MKRTLIKWIGIAAMAGAITFSVIQARIPVVRADGCPAEPFPGCSCDLTGSVSAQYGNDTYITCYYSCLCGGGGGGGGFLIEREYSYWQ
jgi:hypothetical protein